MLVNEKQEWEMIEQLDETIPSSAPRTRLDVSLRRKCVVIVAMLLLMAVTLTVQSEFLIRSGYNLVELKTQVASLEKENEILHLDVAKLKSPDRIARIATEQLGMVLPTVVYHARSSAEGSTDYHAAAVQGDNPTPALELNKKVEAGQKVGN